MSQVAAFFPLIITDIEAVNCAVCRVPCAVRIIIVDYVSELIAQNDRCESGRQLYIYVLLLLLIFVHIF